MFFDKLLYDYALSFLGLPYRWGGQNPITGFDCSGLVIELLQSCGQFPTGEDTNSQGLFDYFDKGKSTFATSANFGSLVFYGESVVKITHIAFALDRYRVIEAGGGDSGIKSLEDAEIMNAVVRIRPIDARKDRVAILKPSYTTIGSAF